MLYKCLIRTDSDFKIEYLTSNSRSNVFIALAKKYPTITAINIADEIETQIFNFQLIEQGNLHTFDRIEAKDEETAINLLFQKYPNTIKIKLGDKEYDKEIHVHN